MPALPQHQFDSNNSTSFTPGIAFNNCRGCVVIFCPWHKWQLS